MDSASSYRSPEWSTNSHYSLTGTLARNVSSDNDHVFASEVVKIGNMALRFILGLGLDVVDAADVDVGRCNRSLMCLDVFAHV
jgi:hypothetical protein